MPAGSLRGVVTGDAVDRPGSIGVLLRSKREWTSLGPPWVWIWGGGKGRWRSHRLGVLYHLRYVGTRRQS